MSILKIDTTLELISNFRGFTNTAVGEGTIVETLGYSTIGDGGGAQWKRTGNLLTASQSPAQLGDARLSDKGSNEWALASNPISIEMLGATGDDATDNNLILIAAEAAGLKQTNVNTGVNLTTASVTSLAGNFNGNGNIKTSDGKRGNVVRRLSSAPSPLANGGGITNFFNNPFPFPDNNDIVITGSSTVGAPATGYEQYDQTTPYFTGVFFQSGHNESTTTADGRTGWAAYRTRLTANGDGDQFCQNWNVVITNNDVAHTGLFGKPAAGFWNGNMTAAIDNVYFNPVEYNLEDSGFDVRSAGLVVNHKRDNNASAFGEWWCGSRHQATGTVPPDAAFQMAGTWNVGFDATPATNTINAYAQSDGQKMHFDAVCLDVNGAKTYASTFGNSYAWVTSGIYQLVHKGLGVHTVDNTINQFPNRVTVVESLATNGREETTTQVLSALDSVVFIDATGPTNPTYTLALTSAYGGNSGRVTLKRTGAGGTVTIQRAGADNIIDKAGATVTSFTLSANESVELVCDLSGNWHVLYIA